MLSAVVLALFGSLSAPAARADAPPTPPPARPLGALERAAGWQTLFDGESLAGWAAGDGGALERTGGWSAVDGCLHLPAGGAGGALVTTRAFGEFELEFDWCVAPGGNSGVKVRTDAERNGRSALGPEFQVLDDAGHPNGVEPLHEAGALYDLVAPAGKPGPAAAGAWHRGRIVAREGRLEHWLDGVRVVDMRLAGPSWEAALAASKFAGDGDFAQGAGPIALQDHGDEVWYANLRLRDWADMPGEYVDLLAGEGLAGWRALGDARYVREGDEILGEVDGGGQSFLVTEVKFGDFVFEVDVKNELPGNSGIQVRSHVREDGRLYGYQIEIDPSERAWSGGLYDEGRRGWLDNLEGDEAARAAFRDGEWNRYRVECIGPWIRAWVNGLPTADHVDPLDLSGVFGLQVHSGNNTRVRWRRPRVWDLGVRSWLTVSQESYRASRVGNSPLWQLEVDADWAMVRVTLPSDQTLVAQSFFGEEARVESTVEGAGINAPLIFGHDPPGPELLVAPEQEDGEWISLAQYCELRFAAPKLVIAPLGTVEWFVPRSDGRGTIHLSRFAGRAALHVDGQLLTRLAAEPQTEPAGMHVTWTGNTVPKLERLGPAR